tara:strand:- start:1584 stop:2609 length:1026 start_codon:yes stop_codon:yes gene_type:complete
MFNVIITGKILDQNFFKDLIRKVIILKKKSYVEEIILSIWEDQFINTEILNILNFNKIKVIKNKKIKLKHSFEYQAHTLKKGLLKIKNRKRLIIKLRTDLKINIKDIKELSKLDFKVYAKEKILKTKIWIPYFEITKPLYIADEILISDFNNLKFLSINKFYYGTKYFDTGVTHINWYLKLFINRYKSLKTFKNKFGKSYHFNFTRFYKLKKNINNNLFLILLKDYYEIINKYFIVGLKNNNDFELNRKTINFHKKRTKINFNNFNLDKIFSRKNANVQYSGHLFCRNNNDAKKLFEITKKTYIKNSVNIKSNNEIKLFLFLIKERIYHYFNFIIFKLNFN